jgi:hypothetical protein
MRKKTYIKSIITIQVSLLSMLGVKPAYAQAGQQAVSQAPKLLVAITVDQLRGDCLQYCLHTFGEGGFKRLLRDGLVYSNVVYDYPNISAATSMATIFTGTNPCYNGISGDKKFDFEKLQEVSIQHDPDFMGNYPRENLSYRALMSSTVADVLKIASGGRSEVYAVAPEAVQAILAGGHAANAAFWLEDYNGKWATSTCYKDIPWYVERYNTVESAAERIDGYSWRPALPAYGAFPYTASPNAFFHYFHGKDKFLQLKTSPFINTEITALFERFLQYSDYGKKTYPSLLSLTYYAGDYSGTIEKAFSWEIQDAYCRLDREIEQVLTLVEKYAGLKNTVIFLTSTGYFNTPETNPDVMPPAGSFYPNRCVALLNMYLMSVYGQGDWVAGYYKNQIYLNRKLIEDRQIPLTDIQRKAAEFTIQFSGVQDVSTLIETLYGNWNESVARFRNGMYAGIAGDVIIELKPGWVLVDEKNPGRNTHVRNNAVISPLMFFGQQIVPQRIFKAVKATQIAPTVSHILRIRPPNAARELPLEEFLQ